MNSTKKSQFKDYFSKQSNSYAQFRPQYPTQLFDFLSSLTLEHDLAWDCGTGNGQAAVSLIKYFKSVIATDASAEQIKKAFAHEKIRYQVCTAETSELATSSVDLITVAAAIHWFDLEKFYPEVRRILKKKGVIAAWSYSFPKINNRIDAVVDHLAHDILKEYWPKENQLVWSKYADLPFPFEAVTTPQFECKNDWNLSQLTGYLLTWSSTQRYILAKNSDPVEVTLNELKNAWGNPEEVKEVNWEFGIKVGRN